MTKTTKPGLWGGVSPTLNAFDNAHETRATVVIATDVEGKEVAATLRGFGHGWQGQHNSTHAVVTEETKTAAIPIQDGREMEKKQNGLGIGSEGDPSYTLDQTGAQAVAYSIREDAKANNFSATEIQTARALQALQPSVQSHHAQTFIAEPTMQVRRLTPLECNRLMGWPDNHTAMGVNGPISDTNQYKMCGNGVASPVAQWIGEAIMRCRPDAEPRSFMDHYLDQLEAERRSDAGM